jgi:hypothetical protein
MKRLPALALVALVVAACGGDDAATTTLAASITEAIATTAVTTTTVAPVTTAATTTTVATTTTAADVFVVDTVNWLPAVFGTAGGPNGSGCVVSGDVLPDGVWMGFAEAVSGSVITFDLACYFSGDAADTAANADYGGSDGAEEGFYIRNQNPKVFTVPIAPTAAVYSIDAAGPTWFPESIALASWPSGSSWLTCPGESCAVWLYVNGGVATGIVEQYLP